MGDDLLSAIRPWNTHWGGGDVSELLQLHPRTRAAVRPLAEEFLRGEDDQWRLVAGPRQVGKTTTLGHVTGRLLQAGVDPSRVIAIPLDQPPLGPIIERGFAGLLDELIGLRAPTPEEPLYVLVDEVQEMDGWAPRLKAAWDRYHQEVRVLGTGSSAMQLVRPADADFPGRIRVSTMHPMKFREVVEAHPELEDHVGEADWQRVVEEARVTRTKLENEDPSRWLEGLEALLDAIAAPGSTLESFLNRVFREYVFWGGMPRARAGSPANIAQRREVFRQGWDAVLAKDAAGHGVKKLREFERLFHRLGRHPGGKFVPHNLSSELGPKSQTLSGWKRVLEDAMLLQQLPPLKPNLEATRGKDKVYPIDPGWHAYLTGATDADVVAEDASWGHVVETVIVDHARRLQYNLAGTTDLPIGYVTTPEVDVAIHIGDRWVLIESKYERSVGGLGPGLENAGSPEDVRVVVTRDHLELGEPESPTYVPAHAWALLC